MTQSRYSPPSSNVADAVANQLEYAGFWIRVLAALIDTVLIIAVTFPLLYAVYGAAYFDGVSTSFFAGPADILISYVLPAVGAILFWRAKQGTPGKLAFAMRVVDARTGKTLSVGQSIGRYFGYFASMLPLGLGIVWVGLDARKQGWHDKLAGSVVVRVRSSTAQPVVFDAS